ncbi:MAG: molybdopterin-binding protein, partial [Acidobacteriota bacterium]
MADEFLRAEIIAVGSELLDLGRVESNSIFLSQRLKAVGARVKRKWVVGDSLQEIEAALQAALQAPSEVIVFSGGLGPTNDDITRESVAQALQRPLHLNPAIIEDLKRRAASFGLRLTDNNRRQAMVPEGAEVLENPNGSAPGLFLQQEGALIFLLPGPPRELEPMTEARVLGRIRHFKPAPQAISRCLKLAGLGESQVDQRVEEIYKSYSDVETTILSSVGIIDLHFLWTGPDDPSRAEATLDELTGRVRDKLGSRVYADRDLELEE